MREHKFCGKRLDNGEWVTGYFTKNESNGNCYITTQTEAGGAHPHRVDSETVGEFTGRKDISGIEIYEGHILKSPSTLIKYLVQFDSENSSFVALSKSKRGRLDEFGRAEIIGSIHDNPELLEVQP